MMIAPTVGSSSFVLTAGRIVETSRVEPAAQGNIELGSDPPDALLHVLWLKGRSSITVPAFYPHRPMDRRVKSRSLPHGQGPGCVEAPRPSC